MYRKEARKPRAARRNLFNTRKQSSRAPQSSSTDLSGKGVVDGVCPPKNMDPSTESVEEHMRAPHTSLQDPISASVIESTCPPKTTSPSISSLEELTGEKPTGVAAGEEERWIAAAKECFELYTAESAKVPMEEVTEWTIPSAKVPMEEVMEWTIPSQLDMQALLLFPDVTMESDQQICPADRLKLDGEAEDNNDEWLDDADFSRWQESWLSEGNQTRDILSASCQVNTESTSACQSQATEEQAIIPASRVEMQGLEQNKSLTIFQSHLAAPILQHKAHLDCTSYNSQGIEILVDLQLDYPFDSNVGPSGQVLPDNASAGCKFVQPLPEVRDADFRLECEKPMPVGLSAANHTITSPALCSGPANVPLLTSDYTEAFIPRAPIPGQVYPEHPFFSHPGPPQFLLTNPKDITEIPTLAKSAKTVRNPGKRFYDSDQVPPLSVTKESLSTVAVEHASRCGGPGAESNSHVRGSKEGKAISSEKRRHSDILHSLVAERLHICKSMLGFERMQNTEGLKKSLDDVVSIHQKCSRKGREPFHIHEECASKEDTGAAHCCWLKQFGSLNPDGKTIMRSFQQMCTRVVNSAARKTEPHRINRFPDWINEEFGKFVKLHPYGTCSSANEIEEIEEFAETLGIDYRQVMDKLKHLRFNVALGKRKKERQANGESPSLGENSDNEVLDATSGRNFGPLCPLPLAQTAKYRDQNIKRRELLGGHHRKGDAVKRPRRQLRKEDTAKPPQSQRKRTRKIEAVYGQADGGGSRQLQAAAGGSRLTEEEDDIQKA